MYVHILVVMITKFLIAGWTRRGSMSNVPWTPSWCGPRQPGDDWATSILAFIMLNLVRHSANYGGENNPGQLNNIEKVWLKLGSLTTHLTNHNSIFLSSFQARSGVISALFIRTQFSLILSIIRHYSSGLEMKKVFLFFPFSRAALKLSHEKHQLAIL